MVKVRKISWVEILIYILVGLFIVGVFVAKADEALILEKVVPGTVASSEKMNARLEAIEATVNDKLVVMFDYSSPVNTNRVFNHTNSPPTITTITNVPGMETWQYEDGHKIEYLTTDSAEGTTDIGRREYNTSGVMTQNLTYDPPVLGVDISAPITIGKIWGNAYITKKSGGSTYGTEVNMYSVIGIETITVPAGTFENCIKVFHTTGNYKNVAWYAEGVGMIKRIGVDGLMELK